MEIIHKDNKVILKNIRDFEPKHIFECGQCFRWDLEDDGSYIGVAYGKILNVRKEEDTIVFNNTNIEDFNNIWTSYFDLNNNYGKIKEDLSKDDEVMKDATNFGYGIRILKQEPWETLISFIISANNAIPRIKKSVRLLSENFGEYLGQYDGKDYYSFPTPEAIYNLSEEQLAACGVGYRSKYILNTARAVIDENISLEQLKELNSEDCFEAMRRFSGVGPKVANCILVFAMGKVEAVPVDVWVKRVMEYFYFHKDTPNKKIEEFARDKFGKYGGYAQQYLFYYARELGIGK
ncbi:DNA glycosylase [Alkaliphilus sp. MSJ-5]|uniref:DNA glycosylase n=1 Tax=Alkaliphilus flagellatus TaxID=2841507 RepID=A0ABS6G2P1_9FIRM|nr:DNA glycosylase [Alkaliphilus flagellatus]MBU5676737.1 DNA glycosylase [Alkaliphilus flagellatus]